MINNIIHYVNVHMKLVTANKFSVCMSNYIFRYL